MKNNKILIFVASLFICSLAWNIYITVNTPKVRYVDFEKLFQGFSGRKELEKKYESIKNQQKFIIDSLSINLKMAEMQLGQNPSNPAFTQRLNNLRRLYSEFEEKNANLEEQFISQALTQVNTFVKKYGKQKGYTVIIGANGNGSLMYADERCDITDETLKFINEEYEKK